jgi:hypothetical protein
MRFYEAEKAVHCITDEGCHSEPEHGGGEESRPTND